MKRRSFLKSLAALVISVSVAKELGALDPIRAIEEPAYSIVYDWRNWNPEDTQFDDETFNAVLDGREVKIEHIAFDIPDSNPCYIKSTDDMQKDLVSFQEFKQQKSLRYEIDPNPLRCDFASGTFHKS